jgi:hypothetical protein
MTQSRRRLWPVRNKARKPASEVLDEALETDDLLTRIDTSSCRSVSEIRDSFREPARRYFAVSALSRRAVIDPAERERAYELLYKTRAKLENRILQCLFENATRLPVLETATSKAFFGNSKKQGVSIRYALATCVPTSRCGSRCYAHDGRDRELQHIFRGVLNFYVGRLYETGSTDTRTHLLQLLQGAFDKGVEWALEDCHNASKEGYRRHPRIRFSHVGEMTATPGFTNAIARELKRREPGLQCVIYTRHPSASRLDPHLLVINFTLEGATDPRARYAPPEARIVNSAWDGVLNNEAEINFLEHHIEKQAVSRGIGSVCPVTMDDSTVASCDEARCQKCFVPTTRLTPDRLPT